MRTPLDLDPLDRPHAQPGGESERAFVVDVDLRDDSPNRQMSEGSVKGHGQLSVVPGVGDPGVSGLPTGGVTVITNVKRNENNEDFDGWDYSFKHYPNAEAVN